MNYKFFFLLLFSFFLNNCDQSTSNKLNKINFDYENRYKNSGFALIYDEKLEIKELDQRSLNIYHKSLKSR